MAWIELSDERGQLGRHDLPRTVTGVSGQQFTIGYARGGGGNGVVFESRRGRNTGGARCALKVLRRLNAHRRDRFANESRIMAALNHRNIAAYFDSGTTPIYEGLNVPWIAMDLGGPNLREHVDLNGPLPVDTLLTVALQMCDALEHLHQKDIIHRDLKPDNFVWELTGPTDAAPTNVRMIDFGIAKYVGEDVSARPLDQLTQHLEFVGPVFFASPELIAYGRDKSHPVDKRSDLFQLAKVLWFLATGRVSAGSPAQKLCPLNGALCNLVASLLVDDPDDRPATVNDVRVALTRLQGGNG